MPMRPPVALLLHVSDEPKRALFYPFAVFSPEWQALHYGLTNGACVRFIDLPAANLLALPDEERRPSETDPSPRQDPLACLAEAAGYNDGERWWEHMVEHRRDGANLFAAILEAMGELRSSLPPSDDLLEPKREAHMRLCIRQAQADGFQRVAVVCGAWHAPALADLPSAAKDTAVLKGLAKVKVQATWVPWTYDRLSYYSGYGAGIESPGWYHHLWTADGDIAVRWMTKCARLLRDEDLDASSAHVIEAVRLAESLAAVRERPLPGLAEMNEAARAVFCFGSDLPMRLIAEKLIVGEILGGVPEETPMVPLQQDLAHEQKRLRLPAENAQKALDLDLRKPNDLDRSRLLHRLDLLEIPWGVEERVSGKSGTFHELWRVQWQPEFAIALIEAARWGNTVLDAATEFARDAADRASDLPALTSLLDRALVADIPDAVEHLVDRLQEESAVASDILHLMKALPPLANVLRYGNVRQTDASMVRGVVNSLVPRICIGLPGVCSSLNDEAAAEMFACLLETNTAIALLASEDYTAQWQVVVEKIADQRNLHGLLAGRCCRLLLDAGRFASDDAARRLSLALSTASDASTAAAWVEGLLQGSGLLLLHSEGLWRILDSWISELKPDVFQEILPLLRRTFSTFAAAERRQMGERARRGELGAATATRTHDDGFNTERADAVLPLIAKLLGLEHVQEETTV